MTIVFTIVFVLTALLLIGVVLIQQPKTAGGLFSGTGQSLLGTSGKSFWTKFTTILAGVFMALCLVMSFLNRTAQTSHSVLDTNEKPAQATQSNNPNTASSTQQAPNTQAQTNSSSMPGNSKP
jgi:preprotein translocase subunit SecG